MIKDIICQVYAGQKSKKMIDLVLNNFISEYEKLNLDYALPISNLDDNFNSEEEMISYFIEKKEIDQTFYWSQVHNNPNRIMVGAIITDDDKLTMSLTFDGDKEIEKKYFNKLKCILNSEIGIISYVNPAEYENGKDFVLKYA
ncbi:hypothetical protein HX096_01055 [Empedobacter falsenii]|uniref:hypothetical protein n=1 Tax=Empedobacter falsenii TaxID=343874 RepID=UPI0025790149|nr:hypothetical protein [Empedobacter falsenii]MDM1546455.1 hypothetical protein [Empedobacter falsenii]